VRIGGQFSRFCADVFYEQYRVLISRKKARHNTHIILSVHRYLTVAKYRYRVERSFIRGFLVSITNVFQKLKFYFFSV